jgi:hypothetical protein
MSRSQFNLRWPADGLQLVKDEAERHGITTAALIRINCIQAREARGREELKRTLYPAAGARRLNV